MRLLQTAVAAVVLVLGTSSLAEGENKEKSASPTSESAIAVPAIGASHAYLLDFTAHTALFAKNAAASMVPSSMTKLLTLYELFSALKEGRLRLTDTLPVSSRAWNARGSRSFLNVGDHVTVEDLIRCIIVHSGNDACVVVAEALGGSEETFAEMMTQTAQRFGAQATQFKNSTGWPDDGHYSSAEDLALIASRLLSDFPEYYHYFSEKEFVISGILQRNRNTSLWHNIGADGLKTGRTDAGGYGVVLSAQRKGRRLIAVVNGCPNDKDRTRDAETLIHWGFNGFAFYKVAQSKPVSSAEVWLGEVPTVDLVTHQDIPVVVPRARAREVKMEVVYRGPLEAPLAAGVQVASLWVSVPGREPKEYPLFTSTEVRSVGPFKRIQAAITYLLFGAQAS